MLLWNAALLVVSIWWPFSIRDNLLHAIGAKFPFFFSLDPRILSTGFSSFRLSKHKIVIKMMVLSYQVITIMTKNTIL